MIKKLSLSVASILLAATSFGQTIVPTTPQNKNVVLEEFTGIHCGFCPDGHAIANAIQDANPERVSIINVHAGSYAVPSGNQPDFRTPYGNALVNQSYSGGNFGFPSGTVNRHVFPGRSMATGGGTAMGRNYWAVSANEILAAPSNVNVGVEASIDMLTRVLSVHVEAYYTGNSNNSTNMLNVALLQNNTLGYQAGGGQGNNYRHMHRLVDLLTGQWGEEITTTSAGSFVDRTYTYTIPEMYNNMAAVLEDMEIVAFIAEDHQEIPTGKRTRPLYTNLTKTNDASLTEIKPIDPTCFSDITPVINVKNEGQNTLTSLVINYEINGESYTYNWTGSLPALWDEDIELPVASVDMQATNTISVTLPDDEDNSNNTQSLTFEQAPQGTGTVNIEIRTDNWGYEFSWELRDSSNNLVESGANYGNNATVNLQLQLDADCYTFITKDSFGDGGTRFTATDSDGLLLFRAIANWGAKKEGEFSSNGVMGVNDAFFAGMSIYPVPANDVLNITSAEAANVQIYDMLGRVVLSRKNISANEQINVSSLNTGTYFVKISKEGNETTKKIVVTK